MSLVNVRRVLLFASLIAVLASALSVRAADVAVPQADREAIEAIIKKKIADLANEKDKDGIGYKRGTFSKSFKKVDASTYVVAFSRDTIENKVKPDTDQIKTERLDLTFKKTGGTWALANEEVKDSFVALYRGYFGGPDRVFSFQGLSFEKEGLKVSASNGYAYTSERLGGKTSFTIFADDLKFDYAPPADTADTSHFSALNKKIAKEHPEDIVFKPERLSIFCDAKTCDEFTSTVFTGLTKLPSSPDASGSAPGALGRMAKRLKEQDDEVRKERRESPFGAFQRLPDPDNRYWTFFFKRAGAKDHFAQLSYDNLDPWQMTYSVTEYGDLYAYYSEDTRNKGIDPLVLEERQDEDTRDFDLVGLKGNVDLMLEDPTAYSGDITYKLRIKRELKELPFFIARVTFPGGEEGANKNPRLFINSIQDEKGNELTWSRFTSFGGLVVFPEKKQAEDIVTIRVQFLNYDAIYSLNPSFYGLARGGWLPFVRFGDFINEFDLTVRLPEKFELLGVGKIESNEIKDGLRVAHFTSPSPVTFPTIIFGDYISDDAGEYQVTKSDGTVVPVRVWVDKGSLAGLTDGGAAASGARDIRGKQLKSIATQASVALNLYKEIFGVDYPFAKLDLVADPLGSFYGQAPASLIYLGFGVFRGEGTVATQFGGGSNIAKFNKDVVAHEVGHQWWGGVVTNANFRNYWFVETLAEVSSALYVEKVHGKKKYLEKVEEWRNTIMENDPVTSVQNGYTMWAGDDEGGRLRPAVANIYNKGPYAFHIFRSTFGDEKFFQLMKEMAQTLQHKEIVTREMQEVMEKVVGGNMDWFFDQWLRGVGQPQYALFWTKRKNEQGKWIVEGSIKQRVVFGADKTELKGVYYRAVAPLTFVDANGKETKAAKPMLVQGAETPFRVLVAEEPEQVYFNKDGEILAEDLLVNRSW